MHSAHYAKVSGSFNSLLAITLSNLSMLWYNTVYCISAERKHQNTSQNFLY